MSINNYTLNPDEGNKKTINYDELRYAAYTNLAYSIKNSNFQAGVRYEFSDIDIAYAGHDTTNTYGEFLPFLSAQTKISKKQTLRLNYRRSLDRPGLNEINPFSYTNDLFSYTVGNPDLVPGKIHSIEFNHRINIMGPLFINYKPYLKFRDDDIALVTYDTNAISTARYKNIGKSTEYGVKINGSLSAAKWFMVNPSFTYYHKNIEKVEGIEGLNKDMWRLQVSANFMLPKDWVIFLDYNAHAPTYNHEEVREQMQMVVGGFYKKVNDRWSITAFTLNPFFHRYEFEKKTINKEGFYQQSVGYVNYSYVFNIRIQYNFNVGKDIKKVERDVQKDEDASQGGGGFF